MMSKLIKKKILIADDSVSIRKFVEAILKKAGYAVITAKDGREALKLAFENEIDAVIADANMPNLTGSQMFKILKMDPEKKDLPLIMITGLAPENADKPGDGLADVCFEKDTDLRINLLSTLEKLL
ncbi:MAG: response regulator [Pyrinomonadaceae bacterium]